MSKVKWSQIYDSKFGIVTVMEHEHGMMMTNAKPDTRGHWVKKDENSYVYELYPNRAQRRAKR